MQLGLAGLAGRNGSATITTATTAMRPPRISAITPGRTTSRATSRRCSRASGHIATSDPKMKTYPAIQSRLTSGFTSTLK